MHYVAEVIIPPTDDVEAAINQVMDGFHEEEYDEDGKYEGRNPYGFYDWYVIGGRWSGEKVLAKFGQDRINAFYKRLNDEGITVSSVVCGKQTLSPASQIPKVDAMWQEDFPDSGLDKCPFFDHSSPKWGGTDGWPDIMEYGDCPPNLKAATVIIGGKHWNENEHPDELQAKFLLQKEFYNGCIFQDTNWDGSIEDAVKSYEEYRERNEGLAPIENDWLVVTVDYHS